MTRATKILKFGKAQAWYRHALVMFSVEVDPWKKLGWTHACIAARLYGEQIRAAKVDA